MEDEMFKKQILYNLIISIEKDFIENLNEKLNIIDISEKVICSVKNVKDCDLNNLKSILTGCNLQLFIEICNYNKNKLGIKNNEYIFLNKTLTQIIPVRNNVMHPRPLQPYDYCKTVQCSYDIIKELKFINWKNTLKVNKLIEQKKYDCLIKIPEQHSDIIDNIPIRTDFDDTSFIGRKKEIGEIKEKLNKRNVNILSIIGDGGIGKTAITLKLLKEIKEDFDSQFKIIIWVTLKTTHLNGFEFDEIEGAIKNSDQMFLKLEEFIGGDDPRNEIIEISKAYKTLFVLDNLETLNTYEIASFLDELSEYAKILITSRIGLGEMEHRYRLKGLSDDEVIEYFNRLLEINGMKDYFTDFEKKKYAIEDFSSNPLAIKWFVKGIKQGFNPEELASKKNDVVNFCMSDVYNKLPSQAKKILDYIVLYSEDMKYSELIYFLNYNSKDYINIRDAINELNKSNFIDNEKWSKKMELSLPPFAKEYLNNQSLYDAKSKENLKHKQQKLNSFIQNLQIKNNNSSPKNIWNLSTDFSNKDEIISALYLIEALRIFKNKELTNANELIDIAEMVNDNYFECNRVRAYINASINPQKTFREIKVALSKCKNNSDVLKVQMLHIQHLLRLNCYEKAIEILNELKCKEYNVNDLICVKLELIKTYNACGRFDEAQKIADEININIIEKDSDKNTYLCRAADILKKKSNILDFKDNDLKIKLLKEAIDILLKAEKPDKYIYNNLADCISFLCYHLYNNEICAYISDFLSKYYNVIYKTENYSKFIDRFYRNRNNIKNDQVNISFNKYLIDLNYINKEIKDLGDNKGIITNVKSGFGFFKNRNYPSGVYFKFNSNTTYCVGDIINFKSVVMCEKGPMVNNYSVNGHISDLKKIS